MEMDQVIHAQDSDHKGFPWKHVVGFFLSLVLTVAALYIVFTLALSAPMTVALILVLAIFQVLVQLMLFMHLNEHEGAFQITAIVFGFFVAFSVVAGSIWIMSFGM